VERLAKWTVIWIQSVYVLPAHRGDGVFRSLFGHLESVAREDPRICGIRLYVDRRNARAQEVYGRMGMHRSNYGVMETVFSRAGVARVSDAMLKRGETAPDFELPDQDGTCVGFRSCWLPVH
jgi:ribosomal protein S18 acetylase RimI-like enzyme